MVDIDKERLSILYWLHKNQIVNERGNPIEFTRHRFMIDLYIDRAPIQCIIKGSQVGASTMEILRLLHTARYHGLNQIYTLPTVTDAEDFVKSKVNQMILRNPSIKAGLSSKDVDSIKQKQIGSSFIHFRGTWSQSEAIMLSSDRNLHDELDKSNMAVVEAYQSRQAASDYPSLRYFSTPTVPDFGIDSIWAQSDQKHWRFNCPKCKHRQHMTWEDNVDLERRCYMCSKCHAKITPKQISDLGKWEPKYPGRDISGYHISQLIAPWITAEKLIQKHEKAEDLSIFHNFTLGMPYVSSDQQIPASLFIRNLQEDGTLIDKSDCNMLGADAGGGKGHHIVIGNKKGVFWMGVLQDDFIAGDGDEACKYCGRPKEPGKCGCRWEQLAGLIRYYDIRVGVIDGLPYTEEAYTLAREFPYIIYLNWYMDDPKLLEVVRFQDETRDRKDTLEERVKVYTARTRVIDQTIAELRRGQPRFVMRKDTKGFQMLLEHAKTMYARNVTNRFGQTKREWANTGACDLFHALIYFKIAYKKGILYEPNKD